MAKIDFTQVEEGFPLWPEGEFDCVLTKAELKRAKSKHFMFNLEFEPMSDEVTGKAFDMAPLAPGALWRTKQKFLRLGLDPDVWAELGAMDSEDEETLRELNEKVQELIGNECVIINTHEEYIDEESGEKVTKNNVARILSAGATRVPV